MLIDGYGQETELSAVCTPHLVESTEMDMACVKYFRHFTQSLASNHEQPVHMDHQVIVGHILGGACAKDSLMQT